MASRLLDQQVSLLEYLTSAAAIFGNESDASLGPGLHGIDRRLLRLEARFSYEKRMEKIVAVFPRTFELLGASRASTLRPFVEAYPPTNMSRLANGRQFYEFLLAQWRREPPELVYLPDIAACELAVFESCNLAEDREASAKKGNGGEPRPGIRRHHRVILLCCAYDIRSIFEGGSQEAAPAKRDTRLALIQAGSRDLRIFEVSRVVFDLLAALDDWVDPRTLSVKGGPETLVGELSGLGLIEVHA